MLEADFYAKNKICQKNDALYILENYFRLIKLRTQGDDEILDIGCGDGEISIEILFKQFPTKLQKFVGVDISGDMIGFATKKYKKNKEIAFLKLDIATTTLPIHMEESFHHVFSFYCLHWVANQTQAVKNIYKLLKPGGDMLVGFICTHPIYTIYNKLQNHEKWFKYLTDSNDYVSPYHNRENPAQDFENLLKKTGFSVPVCTIIDRAFTFKNLESLRNSIIAVNPFLHRIPDANRREYMDDIILAVKNMKLIESNNNNEETCVVPYQLLVAFAKKPEL